MDILLESWNNMHGEGGVALSDIIMIFYWSLTGVIHILMNYADLIIILNRCWCCLSEMHRVRMRRGWVGVGTNLLQTTLSKTTKSMVFSWITVLFHTSFLSLWPLKYFVVDNLTFCVPFFYCKQINIHKLTNLVLVKYLTGLVKLVWSISKFLEEGRGRDKSDKCVFDEPPHFIHTSY